MSTCTHVCTHVQVFGKLDVCRWNAPWGSALLRSQKAGMPFPCEAAKHISSPFFVVGARVSFCYPMSLNGSYLDY